MKIVLVWASKNKEKYWNKILNDLISKWHTIYPVNPNEDNIEWIKVYKDLWDIKEDYEIIDFVVHPDITLNILKKYKDKIYNKKIWIQPWASDEKIKEFLEKNWFKNYIIDSCIMIEKI